MVKHIKVADETKNVLDSLKHPGQTYDGIIQEIIEKLRKREKKQAKT